MLATCYNVWLYTIICYKQHHSILTLRHTWSFICGMSHGVDVNWKGLYGVDLTSPGSFSLELYTITNLKIIIILLSLRKNNLHPLFILFGNFFFPSYSNDHPFALQFSPSSHSCSFGFFFSLAFIVMNMLHIDWDFSSLRAFVKSNWTQTLT